MLTSVYVFLEQLLIFISIENNFTLCYRLQIPDLQKIFHISNTKARDAVILELTIWEKISNSCFTPSAQPNDWSHGIFKLRTSLTMRPFFDCLRKIDFSKYSYNVAHKLKDRQKITVASKYDGPIFIPAYNISAVEILRYESYYAISFQENHTEKIIPAVYEVSTSPLL